MQSVQSESMNSKEEIMKEEEKSEMGTKFEDVKSELTKMAEYMKAQNIYIEDALAEILLKRGEVINGAELRRGMLSEENQLLKKSIMKSYSRKKAFSEIPHFQGLQRGICSVYHQNAQVVSYLRRACYGFRKQSFRNQLTYSSANCRVWNLAEGWGV